MEVVFCMATPLAGLMGSCKEVLVGMSRKREGGVRGERISVSNQAHTLQVTASLLSYRHC